MLFSSSARNDVVSSLLWAHEASYKLHLSWPLETLSVLCCSPPIERWNPHKIPLGDPIVSFHHDVSSPRAPSMWCDEDDARRFGGLMIVALTKIGLSKMVSYKLNSITLAKVNVYGLWLRIQYLISILLISIISMTRRIVTFYIYATQLSNRILSLGQTCQYQ